MVLVTRFPNIFVHFGELLALSSLNAFQKSSFTVIVVVLGKCPDEKNGKQSIKHLKKSMLERYR